MTGCSTVLGLVTVALLVLSGHAYDNCHGIDCHGHGTCWDGTCECDLGYRGDHCKDYDPCLGCGIGGWCETVDGKPKCVCRLHHYGDHCENYDHCHDGTLCGLPDTCKFDHKRPYCVCKGNSKYHCSFDYICSQKNVHENGYYFPHQNPRKYIQCDDHGKSFVRRCARGTVWNQRHTTCTNDHYDYQK